MPSSNFKKMTVPLSEAEEKTISMAIPYLEMLISSSDKMLQATAGENLLKFNYKKLIKACQLSTTVEYFCRNNDEFKLAALHRLTLASYSVCEIKSMDGAKKIDIVDSYVAAYYLNDFSSPSFAASNLLSSGTNRAQALDYACQLGLNEAFLVRWRSYEKIVTNMTISLEQRKFTLTQINADVQKMRNLYWGMGFVQAGLIYYNLGNFFNNLNTTNPADKCVLIPIVNTK